MELELILVILPLIIGVISLLFASRIGKWCFNIRNEMRKDLPSPVFRFTFSFPPSLLLFVWLSRIIGAAIIFVSAFFLYLNIFM